MTSFRTIQVRLAAFLFVLFAFEPAVAQFLTSPQPGDIYKEFGRIMSATNKEWRVTDPNALNSGAQQFKPNPIFTFTIGDTVGAIRAEAVIDYFGGHVGTTGKKFRLNNKPWITIPEMATANGIPAGKNGQCYYQQSNPVLTIPLSDLKQGSNTLEGTSGGQTCFGFNWGQWGWYGIIVRVYYNGSKPHPTGSIIEPVAGATLIENPQITASVSSSVGINRVEFFGSYNGYDPDGDGVYGGYQQSYHRGKTDIAMSTKHNIGAVTSAPFQLAWNTANVPDQVAGTVKVYARIRDNNGVWFVTNEVVNLSLDRDSTSVKLYKPASIPEQYGVRSGRTTKTVSFTIPATDNLARATSAKLIIRTWNGSDEGATTGETHSLTLNTYTIPNSSYGEGNFYDLDIIDIPTSALRTGSNSVTFFANTIHHGIDILHPGPAVLVTYNTEPAIPPAITSHPANQSVGEGQTAVFTVSTTGSAPLLFQWQKNGANISGATSSSYTTPPVVAAESGSAFRCVVSNTAGTVTSNSATLTVSYVAPAIAQEPASQTVQTGKSATFSVTATGSLPINYQWKKNGANIAGATSAWYTTPVTVSGDNGAIFTCVLTNNGGTLTTQNAVLTLSSTVPASSIVSDDFNASVLNTNLWTFVNPGTPSTLLMTGAGTQDARLSMNVPAGSAHDMWSTGAMAPRIMQVANNTDFEIELKFEGPATSQYQMQGVMVEQNDGNYIRFDFVRRTSELRVYAATFVNNTPTQRYNSVITITNPIYMRVKRVGNTWTHSYSYNGTTWLTSGAPSFSHTLVVGRVGPFFGNSGSPPPAFTGLLDYFFNRVSPISPEDGATVPPAISVQPSDQVVTVSQTAVFSVTATGSMPLLYQWQKNAVDIPGATSSTLNVPFVTLGDNGNIYRVIVTNGLGSVASNNALLTVGPHASGIISEDFNSYGLNLSLWAAIDPIGDCFRSMIATNTDDASFQVVIPAGSAHDAWSGLNASYRLIQSANNTDFELEAKFGSALTAAYQIQGIIIEQDIDNYLRFDFTRGLSATNVFAASIASGSATARIQVPISAGAPYYLRVKREGNLWTESYSTNGINWTVAGSFTRSLTVTGVGPFFGNAGTPAPLFTGQVDYFLLTAAPFEDEDGGTATDSYPPVIGNVQLLPGASGITVTWITDEPTTGLVEYGTSTLYELGSEGHQDLQTFHAVQITGLQPQTLYNLRVRSDDESGNFSQTGNLVTTTVTPTNPVLSVWYGNNQTFGNIGNPVPLINILGNVTDDNGVMSLSYILNGDTSVPLKMGPDTRRLQRKGDFNADIPYASLQPGPNQMIITAIDSQFTVERETVIVNYVAGNSWPKAYSIDWSTAAGIPSVAQVLDGKWAIQNGELTLLEPGYDRLIAIGEQNWVDYELTVPITIDGLDSAGQIYPSNGSAIGFVVRFPGHTDYPPSTAGYQPKSGYLPLGAFAAHNWRLDGSQQLDMLGNNLRLLAADVSNRQLTFSVKYMFKVQVKTTQGVGGLYKIKIWPFGSPEPVAWDLIGQEPLTGPQSGCVLLTAHQVYVRFGNVTVVPLDEVSTIISDDFYQNNLNTSLWTFHNPLNDAGASISGAGTSDARVAIAVPGGSNHEPLNVNRSVAVMQAANNTTFDVETRIESALAGTTPMHGIVVEQDSNDFVRYDLSPAGSDTRLFVATVTNGIFSPKLNIVLAGPAPQYMRIQRLAASWHFLYSYDGQAWSQATSFTHSMVVTRIGPFAGNSGGASAPAYTALVDYFFNNALRINPEDAGTVLAATILLEPVPVTVVQGDTAKFSITVGGTPPFAYQWQRNNVNIPGANGPQYALPNASVGADNGAIFRCIVSNSGGIDTSVQAGLTVVYPPSTVISDDFRSPTLNTGLWRIVDPRGDATISMQGTGTPNSRLVMSVPAGVSHDIWTNVNQSPRILQGANNTSFELEAKFESAVNAKYQFQGIIVQQNYNNFLRFDFTAHASANITRAFAAKIENGAATQLISVNAFNFGIQPMWLRVNRLGNTWTMSYSTNGTTWTTAGTFSHTLVVDSVGLFMGNAGSPIPTIPAFSSNVDYFFNNAMPVVPEDPVPPTILTHPLNETITEGLRAAFSVSASGSPPLSYQWQKNGASIPGAVGPTYTTQPMSLEESGTAFRCVVSNAQGSTNSNNAIVSVNPAVPLPWWNQRWAYRIPIEVKANGYERYDKPVESSLDFSIALATLGVSGAGFDTNSVRVIEVDSAHAILDTLVDYQFVPDATFNAVSNATGTVVFMMDGVTSSAGQRFYDVYFDTVGGGPFTAPAITQHVALSETSDYEGQASFRLVTTGGTYYYHKVGAAFASFFDSQGQDWIGYHPTGGERGHFRGIPNMGDAFHPGYTNGSSLIESQGPLRTRIKSKTIDNGWELYWDIFPRYARMTVTKKAATYWWLYEGTPGGNLEIARDFTVRPSGVRKPVSTSWSADLPGQEWTYFGDSTMTRTLYVAHHEDDAANDYFRHQGGDSGMTVFGFGRKDPCCIRYIDVVPNTFTFGFAEDSAFAVTPKTINSAYKPLLVTPGEAQYEGSTGVPTLSTIVSDNFNAPSLNYDLWTYYNPLGDASVSMNGNALVVSIPGGTPHDVWDTGNFAPRVMQPANNTNFEVEAKFLSVMANRLQIQGILVEQDPTNFIRFDFVRNATTTNVFAATFSAGVITTQVNTPVITTSPLYLRVHRAGNQWTQSYSYDGVNWVVAVTFTHSMIVNSVGPFFGNAGPAPSFVGMVDYFYNTDVYITPTKAHGGTPKETEETIQVPDVYSLSPNYPNPFNPTTTIAYGLPEPASVTLKLYNMLGQEIATLVDGHQPAGYLRAIWNGKNNHGSVVGSGVYIYRMVATGASGNVFTNTRKMILTR